ncbi:pyrimidine/purine nucleoside phosphorylase [Geovibrio ferrireducens]|uniref:pyrimidine/purine nucleoside phosphorylase n=1 Tax=Geovibrio ferrireducens TaxID=46201 RepID=UPI0022467AC1|nr:pyrimidine/purine nucleoside phosphorylase [Geovibrio ferrireducens]
MDEFKNVSVVKKANVYFGGKVVSRTVRFEDGSVKTLGFMQAGEYTFNTAEAEIMEFMSGELEVDLPDRREPLIINGECTFEVPANSSFTLRVSKPADYCCSFIK